MSHVVERRQRVDRLPCHRRPAPDFVDNPTQLTCFEWSGDPDTGRIPVGAVVESRFRCVLRMVKVEQRARDVESKFPFEKD